jgi:hypothetical protein
MIADEHEATASICRGDRNFNTNEKISAGNSSTGVSPTTLSFLLLLASTMAFRLFRKVTILVIGVLELYE